MMHLVERCISEIEFFHTFGEKERRVMVKRKMIYVSEQVKYYSEKRVKEEERTI